MILLDTHIWCWSLSEPQRLSKDQSTILASEIADVLGVSMISCWEIAKKVEIGKLVLDRPVQDWLDQAIASPRVQLLPITLDIIIESTRLPQPFHRDPADQLIVATARVLDVPLLTADERILAYPHARLALGR